ncbi:alpha/beta fold hydrolase [Natrinema marinum]|uniref:alpha/beta fold hydrolase n=1 Tax=Natrinema marinum TaxID=2961598 RepID=UPI0020C8E055|nr:alpha/beta fold hydrolase [Natrinema marinum]
MEQRRWLNNSLYPFESNYFDADDGRIHYVESGTGDPILLVHGTPTWSFLYRDLITHLSRDHRVIAVDHLGFGLSDKPQGAGYTPEDHATRLTNLIDYLGVDEFTLVVHDFGGPIGLPLAIRRPETVSRLVLFNTWLWSLKNDTTVRLTNLVMRGRLARLFYCRYNGSARFLLKAAWGDETPLTDEVHRHYTNPFPTAADRTAPLVLAQELIGSTEWYESLWQQRSQITQKPTLVMWGLQDPAFDDSYLKRWEDTLSNATVHRLPNVGHFVPDEAADEVTEVVSEFLDKT